jgi:hypothetical protein
MPVPATPLCFVAGGASSCDDEYPVRGGSVDFLREDIIHDPAKINRWKPVKAIVLFVCRG